MSEISNVHRLTSPLPMLKINRIVMKKNNRANIFMKMQQTDSNGPLDNDIVYPPDIENHHPYDIVAQYRRLLGKSTNFRIEPLRIGEDEIETVILGLNNFANKHGCNLIFTTEEHRFDNSIYRAVCGVADLGSIHLLANDAIHTATFSFDMNFNFNTEFDQSERKVEAFIMNFCQAIATVLSCDINNIRIFSIGQMFRDMKKTDVEFGVTTTEMKKTEQFAEILKMHASSGFNGHQVLERVVPGNYHYKWKSTLETLRLQINDLIPKEKYKYKSDSTSDEVHGWYRHALRVEDKYEEDSNVQDGWSVAFHGTKAWTVSRIVQQGRITGPVKVDSMQSEAIEQIGNEANCPGLYVATHCNGGADIYTEPFKITSFPNKTESFRLVFQCHVKSEKFTVHESPVNVGKAWRYIIPNSIRPYGILLKKESSNIISD
ncbi:hypothetical protein I4U23_016155 [Adineta vaga]|nr:hypothetical protein I4U23_016155 [Adineta vaga]